MAYFVVKAVLTFSLWLWCLTACANSVCNLKLTITNQNNDYDASDLCLEEILSNVCRNFTKTFNRSDLPESFQKGSDPISRPSNINLEGLVQDYEKNGQKFKTPGLRIKWNSPTDEISRRYVEGYLMIWATETLTSCRLFRMNTSSTLLLKNIMMSYDIQTLSDGTNYTVTVYSVPTPYSQNKDEPERFVRMKMTTFTMYEIGVSPGYWKPSVSTKIWPNGTIEARFTLSPPEFNFTSFRLCLVRADNPNNCFIETFYIGNLYSDLEPEGMVMFNHLTDNTYNLVVYPNDTYREIIGQCLCWVYEPFSRDSKSCRNVCTGTATEMFNVTVTEKPGSVPTSQTSSPSKSPETTSSLIVPEVISHGSPLPKAAVLTNGEIAAIVGVLVTVLIIAVIIILVCQRKDMNQLCQKFVSWVHKKLCSESKPKTDKSPPSLTPFIGPSTPLAALQVKKLYIMSADDHSKHVNMVDSLKKYLELHCQCEVVHPATAQDIHNFDSPYTWFISKMSSTDHIIFVTSMGSEKLVEAHLFHKTYRDRELRPEGDLFTECLKYIFKDKKARDKVINIHFGDTKMESEYMKSAFTYSIPRNLPDLLLKIHQLNSKQIDTFSRKLPLLRENIPNITEGIELFNAISSSLQYEKDHFDWFKVYFGEATPSPPSFEKMVSFADSGIGDDMGQRSVSDTDLNHHGRYDDVTYEPSEPSVYTVQFSDTMCNNIYSEPDHVVPPSADFENVSSFTEAMNNINRASDLYENQDDLAMWRHIQPPETMSCVEEFSEAFLNINKLSDSVA